MKMSSIFVSSSKLKVDFHVLAYRLVELKTLLRQLGLRPLSKIQS